MGRSIWPADLAVFYPLHVDAVSWVAAGACALAIATVTAALWWGARRWPFAIVGWLWFLGMLVPVVGVVQVGLQARADRYTYLPMIGLSVVVAWAAVRLAEARPGLRAAAASAGGLAVAALALSAWQRVGDWQDSMTLFQSALAVTERNYVVHEGLGNAMLREGRIQEAVGQYQKALEIRPGYQRASLGLANAWLQQDQVSRALPLYRRALELDPDDARIAGSYGLALLRVGRFEEAEQKLRHGLRVHAGAAELHTGLGAAAQAQGRPREAIDHYRESLVQNPGYREAANNLAWLLATCPSVRRADEAIALAGLAGREPNALDTLAAAHAAAGRFDDAVRIADAAARDALERRLIQLGSAIRERASLYRQKRPYEEPCEGESSAFGSAPGASPGSVLVD